MYRAMTNDDIFYTPRHAWEAIKQFIPNDKVIWEPFVGESNSGVYLSELGFNVIHDNEDFFNSEIKGDIVVSNPPYSIKQEILQKLYEHKTPFILLMPAAVIHTKYMRKFKDDLQIIIPSKRIHYIKGGIQTKTCSFDSVYFAYKMNLDKDLYLLC